MSALTDPIGGMLDQQVAAARGMTDAEALRFLTTGELPDLSRPPNEVTEAPAETAGSEQVRSLGDATLLLANITPLTSSSRIARYDEILSSNVITAAGWKAEAHPRDRHGRFIEKGAVADLLGMKNPTAQHLLDAVAELDPKKWSDLKPAQRKQIADRVAELPAGLQLADPARAKMKKLVGVPEAPKAPKASKTPAVTSTKTAAKKVAVPRGAGGPVVPASIYKKNPDGHVVAESPDGDARLRWDADAKKYVAEKRDGDGWKTEKTLTKAAAYEDVKDPTRWVTSGGQTVKTSNIGTKTEAPSPPLAPEPTPPVVEPTAKSANTSHAGELAHEAYWDKYGDQYRAVKADEKQRGAIEAYTSGGFGTMNGIARGDQSIIGDPEIEDELAQWDEAIAGLDSFVRKQPPLREDVTLFRGVGGEHVPESGEWREKGFTSASWSRPFAENWAEDENVPTLVELRLAKGQPAWVTAPGPESEVILPLDTRYRVISSEVTNGRRHVVAEVVDHPRAAAPSEVAKPASAPPSAVTKPKAPEASVAESGGSAAPTLPDQVEFNPPMYGDGTLITTHQAADRQRAIDELRTKPANFDPNAPVQSGASAFYAALNSAALTPVTKRGDAESKAAATYQDNVAFAWNDLLRHGTKPKKLSDAIKIKNNQPALDALLDRSKLPHAIQVHRGLGDPDGSLLAQLKPGAVFEDRGYVSTTTEKAVAEHFVDKGAIMLDVEVPAGSRAIVPSRWSTTDLDEREVLLPRGSRFEVVGQPTKVDGVTHVKVRAVTDVPSAASLLAATPTTAPVDDGEDESLVAAGDEPHTGAAIMAKVCPEDADRLAVDGGEDADELHMTLMYLGDAAGISQDEREAVVEALLHPLGELRATDGEIFAVSMFNPNGTEDGREPCVVGLVSGEWATLLHDTVLKAVNNVDGYYPPEQRSPWVAHVTLVYTDDADLSYFTDLVGSVRFDSVEVAFGEDRYEIPLRQADDGVSDVAEPSEPPVSDDEDAESVVATFDPGQARDTEGRWTRIGGSSSSAVREVAHGRAALTSVPSPPRVADEGVSMYYGNDFKPINAAYRGTDTPDDRTQRAITSLDEGFTRARTSSDVEVYRGLGMGSRAFGRDVWQRPSLVGVEWTEKAPTSTTANSAVTDKFASRYTGEGAVLRVHVPRGTPAMRLSGWGDEAEVLLKPHLRYRITADHGVENGVRFLDAEVIDED